MRSRLKPRSTNPDSKTVVVVGGGFAGLNAAKALSLQKNLFTVLVDRRNHHLFQPLLYQVATAGLSPGEIAVPIRAQFADGQAVEVHLDAVSAVNLKQRYISTREVDIEYDYLILACGAQHSYFNHPEWETFAPGLKTLEQATEIRRRILAAFEAAENELNPEKQKAYLNFVVVGGGPTGVELAGAIADISRTVLVNDFRRIDPTRACVMLVEAGPRLLSAFSEKLSERARHDLRELGVDVRTNSRVEDISADGVQVAGERILSKCVFWAAGVQARRLSFTPEVETDRSGRIPVQSDLSLPGYPEVFVIGDMAAVKLSNGGFVPGLAPAAIQEGRHVAKVVAADVRGKNRESFFYVDKGQMATIGKNRAVMQTGSFQMGGRVAWLAWLFVHVFYLIGFKNRFQVMFQWAWSYIFSKRGARLITDPDWKVPS